MCECELSLEVIIKTMKLYKIMFCFRGSDSTLFVGLLELPALSTLPTGPGQHAGTVLAVVQSKSSQVQFQHIQHRFTMTLTIVQY